MPFFPHGRLKEYSLNGVHLNRDVTIKSDTLYLFVLSGGCFIAWYGTETTRPDFSQLDPTTWYVYNKSLNTWSESLRLDELINLPEEMKDGGLATFPGLGQRAFLLSDILAVADYVTRIPSSQLEPRKKSKTNSNRASSVPHAGRHSVRVRLSLLLRILSSLVTIYWERMP